MSRYRSLPKPASPLNNKPLSSPLHIRLRLHQPRSHKSLFKVGDDIAAERVSTSSQTRLREKTHSMCSMPTDTRMSSGRTPLLIWSSALSC
mgnify:CR=1 FL=1